MALLRRLRALIRRLADTPLTLTDSEAIARAREDSEW